MVECIYYDGDDPEVIAKLRERGVIEYCIGRKQ